MKLESIAGGKLKKVTNAWKLNNIHYITNVSKKKSKGKLKNILKQTKIETRHIRPKGCCKAFQSKMFVAVKLTLRKKKGSNKLPSFIPQRPEK